MFYIKDYLDRNSNKRLYQQVKEYIKQRIEQGIYNPGEAIPAERELYSSLNVSRYTVRKAIQELVHEGYLYRVRGSGTFVLDDEDMTRNHQNNYIGVVLTHCEHEMEANILSGIENALQASGYRMTFMSSEDDYKKEAEYIQKFKRSDVSGLIIMPAEDQKDSSAIFDLKEEDFPYVLVDRKLPALESDCVVSDNINGAYQAVEYLIELGHKRIAFIKRKFSKTSSIQDRIIGYKNALKEYNLPVSQDMIFSYNEETPEPEIYNNLYNFFQEEKPTAVISINAYSALDIVKMCRDRRLVIPDDFSLICFDNLEFTKHLEVPLTTISQFHKQMGFQATQMLISRIATSDNKHNLIERKKIKQIYLPVELKIRDSCAVIGTDQ